MRPRFMDIRTKFAEMLIDSGDLEKAKTELLVILESRPGFVGARIRPAWCFSELGTPTVRFASGSSVPPTIRWTCVPARTSRP